MDWVWYVALVALLVVGWFVNILGLPGLWVMVLAHLGYALVTGWDVHAGWPSLVAVVVLAGIAEVIEFVAGAAGSKAAGGSKRGMAGAIIGGLAGGIAGTPIFPVVGTIVGAVAGAALGAYVIELMVGRTHDDSLRIGIGAAKGRFWGIVWKSLFGAAILIVSVITAWPTGAASAPPTPAAPPTTSPATAPATSPTVVPDTLPAVER